MPEWWPVIGLFWLFFLWDAISWQRRRRLFWRAPWAGGHAALSLTTLRLGPWLPGGWSCTPEELPCSLSAEGLCSLPVCATSRPAPTAIAALALRWTDIVQIDEVEGVVQLNGQAFCRRTAQVNAPRLRDLHAAILAQPDQAKALVEAWFREIVEPDLIRKHLTAVLDATRTIVSINTTVAFIAAALSLLVLGYSLPAFQVNWVEHLLRLSPWILAYAGLLHCSSLVLAWRVHRHLAPQRVAERIPMVFSAALLPPQALRLRAHLSEAILVGAHPLALAQISPEADRRLLRELVASAWRDLRFPSPASQPPPESLAGKIVEAQRAWWEVQLAAAAQTGTLTAAEVFGPPVPDSAQVQQFCPRCRDQFTESSAKCPHGVALCRLAPSVE